MKQNRITVHPCRRTVFAGLCGSSCFELSNPGGEGLCAYARLRYFLDGVAAKDYMRLAEASIVEYGGWYLVRGAGIEVMEVEPTKRKLVIVEFPSIARAKDWHSSSAYAQENFDAYMFMPSH